MKRLLAQKLAFLLFAVTALPVSIQASILSVSPASGTVDVGGQVTLELDLSGLGNGSGPAVAAYTGVLISFDSGILSATSVVFSNRLGDVSDPTQVVALSNTFLDGSVELDAFSLLPSASLYGLQARPAGSPVDLALITFTALSAGTTSIDLSYGSIVDENGDPLSVDTQSGSVTVNGSSGVPEPYTFPLLISGLLALVFYQRVRKLPSR